VATTTWSLHLTASFRREAKNFTKAFFLVKRHLEKFPDPLPRLQISFQTKKETEAALDSLMTAPAFRTQAVAPQD